MGLSKKREREGAMARSFAKGFILNFGFMILDRDTCPQSKITNPRSQILQHPFAQPSRHRAFAPSSFPKQFSCNSRPARGTLPRKFARPSRGLGVPFPTF